MIRLTVAALMVVLAPGLPISTAQAQSRPVSAFAARLDAEVPVLLEKYQEPGIAVVVVDGCEASIYTYGVARREPAAAELRADTVFQLASLSKTLTAWTVMTLVDAGRIRLDDPVDLHLKRWHLPESSFDRKAVTIRRLLNHTTGISIPSVSGVDPEAPVPSLIDELNGLGRTKGRVEIVRAPGETFDYSGGGYTLLQLIVEDVTGLPFAEYAKRTVFAPLGMTSTSFGWTAETVQRAATPYLGDGSVYPFREFAAAGAAGVVSTAQDMATFLLAHCSRGNADSKNGVLKATTLEQMRTGGVPAPPLGRQSLPGPRRSTTWRVTAVPIRAGRPSSC